MRFRSLREKLLAVMVGVILFLLTAVSMVHVVIQKKIFEEELARRIALMKKGMEMRGRTISDQLARHTENAIAAYDFFGMTQAINKIVEEEEDLDYVIVVDNDHVKYVNAKSKGLKQLPSNYSPPLLAEDAEKYMLREFEANGQSYMEFISTIQMGGLPWGALCLGFSLKRLQSEISVSRQHMEDHSRDFIILSFLFSALCLLFGGIMVYYGARRIVGPIKYLTEFSGRLSRSDFKATIPEEITHASDEIGVLSRAFVDMASKLESSHRQLEEYSYTLEQKVNERTTELQRAFEQIHKAHEELQRSQEHLVQAEKMASLGQLVAGVAHEINTPIGIGVTAASFLQEELEKLQVILNRRPTDELAVDVVTNRIHEASGLILSNLQRASELVTSFKQTSTDQSSREKRRFNMHQVISDTLNTLKPLLKRTRVLVSLNCPVNLEISNFPGSISQVITNLMMNSLDHAFGEEQAGNVAIDVKEIDDDRVEIIFSDDGNGIPDALKTRIFDPFVTTRRGRGGAGLGLYIVFNVIQEVLRGTIQCVSHEGQGAVFTMTIPKNL